jgi:hypothetical protein
VVVASAGGVAEAVQAAGRHTAASRDPLRGALNRAFRRAAADEVSE